MNRTFRKTDNFCRRTSMAGVSSHHPLEDKQIKTVQFLALLETSDVILSSDKNKHIKQMDDLKSKGRLIAINIVDATVSQIKHVPVGDELIQFIYNLLGEQFRELRLSGFSFCTLDKIATQNNSYKLFRSDVTDIKPPAIFGDLETVVVEFRKLRYLFILQNKQIHYSADNNDDDLYADDQDYPGHGDEDVFSSSTGGKRSHTEAVDEYDDDVNYSSSSLQHTLIITSQ